MGDRHTGGSCRGALAADEVAAQRGAFEVDAMRAMDDAVEDGVAESRIADHLVPSIDRDLAGDQQGSPVVAIIDDLEQIDVKVDTSEQAGIRCRRTSRTDDGHPVALAIQAAVQVALLRSEN